MNNTQLELINFRNLLSSLALPLLEYLPQFSRQLERERSHSFLGFLFLIIVNYDAIFVNFLEWYLSEPYQVWNSTFTKLFSRNNTSRVLFKDALTKNNPPITTHVIRVDEILHDFIQKNFKLNFWRFLILRCIINVEEISCYLWAHKNSGVLRRTIYTIPIDFWCWSQFRTFYPLLTYGSFLNSHGNFSKMVILRKKLDLYRNVTRSVWEFEYEIVLEALFYFRTLRSEFWNTTAD